MSSPTSTEKAPLPTPEAGETTSRTTAASDGLSLRAPNKRVVAIASAEGGDAESATLGGAERGVSREDSEARFGLGGNGPPRRMTFNSNGERRLGRTMTDLFKPEHRLAPAPTHLRSFINILKYSPLNVLLVCIPISWALHFALDQEDPKNNLATFITSFLAIMPLAALLSYGTEEVALRVGQTLGGLLNASLGNAVELIVSIIALFKCELVITQTSLIGSILSNLLLVLGMCFFVGGLRYKEQEFKQTAAQLNSSILAMGVIAVIIPAGFHATLGSVPDDVERSDMLKVSHGYALILLGIYAGYLFFQLSSHTHLYEDEEGEEEQVTLSLPMAIALLVGSTVLVGVTSEWLVSSLDGFSGAYGVPKTWIGLILLPIVSNAAEHATAVLAARKNKVDLAMGVAVGSSIQIALFVIPLLVVIAWIADKPLTLLFDPLVAILLFLAVLIVNYAIQDGRSNYMEGWLLMMTFVAMALVAWFIPDLQADSLFSDAYCAAGGSA